LGLSNSPIGILLSAFFWSYASLQPAAGWVAQRFDVRHVLAIGLTIWAIATTLAGLASTFAVLLALRILLGLGESVAYPCIAKLLAHRTAEHQRGRPNGLIADGQALGPTFGTSWSVVWSWLILGGARHSSPAASRLWELGDKAMSRPRTRRDTPDNEEWSGRWESNPRS
jgi:MFS family permease